MGFPFLRPALRAGYFFGDPTWPWGGSGPLDCQVNEDNEALTFLRRPTPDRTELRGTLNEGLKSQHLKIVDGYKVNPGADGYKWSDKGPLF